MISRKLCCFERSVSATELIFANNTTHEKQELSKLCDVCFVELDKDIFERSSYLYDKIHKDLRSNYPSVEIEVIDHIVLNAIDNVRVALKGFECCAFTIENNLKMPNGFLQYTKKAATNLTINYLKSPSAKKMTASLSVDQYEYIFDDGKVAADENSVEDAMIIRQSKKLLRSTIRKVKSCFKSKAELRKMIINLSQTGLANRHICSEIMLNYSYLLPINYTETQLANLVLNTLFQFRNNIKEELTPILAKDNTMIILT
jgi:hypothetical protein